LFFHGRFFVYGDEKSEEEFKSENGNHVFAVGKAELEKEKVKFKKILRVGEFSRSQKKWLRKFYEILINDFTFYGHLFVIQQGGDLNEDAFENPGLEELQRKESVYLIHLKAISDGISKAGLKKKNNRKNSLKLTLLAFSIKDESEIYRSTLQIDESNFGKKSHLVANDCF